MTIVASTFTTYSAKGIREDLSNVITNNIGDGADFGYTIYNTSDANVYLVGKDKTN